MPQVFKREGSPYFYARWQEGGKDHVVSTKCTRRMEAVLELRAYLSRA